MKTFSWGHFGGLELESQLMMVLLYFHIAQYHVHAEKRDTCHNSLSGVVTPKCGFSHENEIHCNVGNHLGSPASWAILLNKENDSLRWLWINQVHGTSEQQLSHFRGFPFANMTGHLPQIACHIGHSLSFHNQQATAWYIRMVSSKILNCSWAKTYFLMTG